MSVTPFPVSPQSDLCRAVLWGVGGYSASTIAFVLIWALFHGFSTFDVPKAPEAGTLTGEIAEFVGMVVVGPLIETALLLWLVRDVRAESMPSWVGVCIVAAVFTGLHALVKDLLVFLPTIFVLFTVFAYYLQQRSASASWRVCWIEGSVMHGVHNALSVVPAMWMS